MPAASCIGYQAILNQVYADLLLASQAGPVGLLPKNSCAHTLA